MKVYTLLSHVTVEPSLFMYYVAASTSSIAETNLLLQKTSSPEHPILLGVEKDYDAESLKTITVINTWTSVLVNALPVAIIIVGGAWSDAHGKKRKPLMTFPIAGEITALCFVTGSVFFWKWSADVTALLAALCRGLSGGRTCFSFGAITYIADITFPEHRTFRMAVITALIFISTLLGYALGGVMRQTCGFYVTFTFCIALNLLALVFALFLIRKNSDDESVEESYGFKRFLDVLKIINKPRMGNKKAIVLLIIVVSPLFGGCLQGEYSVLYLYIGHKFHWGEADSGLYLAFRLSITFFGTLLSVGILSRLLKIPDVIIGLLAATLQFCASLGNASAQHPWEMFLYPLVDLMHGSIFAVANSIVSKTVDPSDMGKINSVISTVDSLIPLIVIPLYNLTYNRTLDTACPGAFFLISSVIALMCLAIFVAIAVLQKKDQARVNDVIW